jgi:renalase
LNVLIIGAGLSGLAAARTLFSENHTVTVLDKGRGLGGRLATRRLQQGRADHGAQYFSALSSDFQELTKTWLQQGLVREWHLEQSDPASFQHPRYAAAEGMNQLTKALATGLDVRTGERVTYLTPTGSGWQVRCESGLTLSADALLLTLPVPQALVLLNESGIALSETDRQALTQVRYEPCLAVMLRLDQPSRIPEPGGQKRTVGPIAWIADNQQKGISDHPTVTLHASHEYSQQHLDEPDLQSLLPELVASVADLIDPATIVEQHIHRWRYSNATIRHPDPYLAVNIPGADSPGAGTLLFGGDGFGKGNVEGAFLSGLAMAAQFTEGATNK